MDRKVVFISGGTGYIGRPLSEQLIRRGHQVYVLARPGSEHRVAPGATVVLGNALDASSFAEEVKSCDTLVHLTGVAHPAPWKERAFRAIDQVSFRASAEAATGAGLHHFVYVSVAHPAPLMKAYIRVRTECEEQLRNTGLPHTILRPWYVLGPGHWWPVILKPLYALMERLPSTRIGARRLGLVTHANMIQALVWAVEHPPEAGRILEVPEIRTLV